MVARQLSKYKVRNQAAYMHHFCLEAVTMLPVMCDCVSLQRERGREFFNDNEEVSLQRQEIEVREEIS